MFANKVVVITGSSAGIGAAAAQCFAIEKADLALVARNEANLKEVARKCKNLGAKNVLVIKADIGKEDDVRSIFEKTIDKYGKLDVLVNNAGIVRYAGIEDGLLLKHYDEVMNTNLRGVVYTTYLAVPYLKKTKGNIINVSSVAAMKVTMPGMMTYCISKAGLDHFTRSVALEMAPYGVRVNSINPGAVDTKINEKANYPSEKLKQLKHSFMTRPLKRMADPYEVGDLMIYLASDKAKSITGSFHVIDNGGMLV